jgi:hypothetical protein
VHHQIRPGFDDGGGERVDVVHVRDDRIAARLLDHPRALGRACRPRDVMVGSDEQRQQSGPDHTGRPGDEDAHWVTL